MFGLSRKKVLVEAIINVCHNESDIYRDGLRTFSQKVLDGDCSEDEAKQDLMSARRDYLFAVFDAMWASFRVSSPAIEHKMRMAMLSPSSTGLPKEFTAEYFEENGIPAGCVYAICYFAVTGKQISTKDFKICSMPNHYQNAIMDNIITEIEKE